MKVTTILLNLALTATAIAAAIDLPANVEKRECKQITDPNNPNWACVPTGCPGLTRMACCSKKFNPSTIICV